MSQKLKVRITGKGEELTVNSFLEVVESSYELLKHLSGKDVTWIVGDVSHNSPVTFEFVGTDGGAAAAAIRRFNGGMGALRMRSDPSGFFDEKATKLARKVSAPLINGISDVTFDAEGESISVPVDLSYLDAPKEVDPYFAFAEVEGSFEKLDLHSGHQDFIIYDRITGHPTACDFSDLDVPLTELIRYARKRLRVTGNTKFNSQHQPIRVKVATFAPVESAVSLEELHKAEFRLKGDLTSEQIIRNLRSLDA